MPVYQSFQGLAATPLILHAQQAVALWPTLEATGMRLGAPGTGDPATRQGGWFQQFWGNVSACVRESMLQWCLG